MFSNDAASPASGFITPFTDMSANIFAMLLLILIFALAGQQQSRDKISAGRGEFVLLERRPMTAARLIQHFYERRSRSTSIRLDLLEQKVTAVSSDGTVQTLAGERIEYALARLLMRAQDDPVRLYVFSHNLYARVIRALRLTGRSWQEISVPQALSVNGHAGWSEEFSALLEQHIDRSAFVDALAQLLASKGAKSASKQNQPTAHSPRIPVGGNVLRGRHAPLSERIAKWWRWAVGPIAILIAFLAIWRIERRVKL